MWMTSKIKDRTVHIKDCIQDENYCTNISFVFARFCFNAAFIAIYMSHFNHWDSEGNGIENGKQYNRLQCPYTICSCRQKQIANSYWPAIQTHWTEESLPIKHIILLWCCELKAKFMQRLTQLTNYPLSFPSFGLDTAIITTYIDFW